MLKAIITMRKYEKTCKRLQRFDNRRDINIIERLNNQLDHINHVNWIESIDQKLEENKDEEEAEIDLSRPRSSDKYREIVEELTTKLFWPSDLYLPYSMVIRHPRIYNKFQMDRYGSVRGFSTNLNELKRILQKASRKI